MCLSIIGATGKSGQFNVEKAVEGRHNVTAIVCMLPLFKKGRGFGEEYLMIFLENESHLIYL